MIGARLRSFFNLISLSGPARSSTLRRSCDLYVRRFGREFTHVREFTELTLGFPFFDRSGVLASERSPRRLPDNLCIFPLVTAAQGALTFRLVLVVVLIFGFWSMQKSGLKIYRGVEILAPLILRPIIFARFLNQNETRVGKV